MQAPRRDWSLPEVEACVASYFRMLTLELSGQAYSKTEHRRALLELLDGRNDAAVEQKHRNISAVLLELGCPSIRGYKPLSNFQRLLREVVESRVQTDLLFNAAALAAVESPAIAPLPEDVAGPIRVDRPAPPGVHEASAPYLPPPQGVLRDYLAREAHNRSLGTAGEIFIAEYEARALHAMGKRALADRVEHVAASKGDGLGYDVLSFFEDGRERFIEVKTTAFGALTPFFVSRNELAFSEHARDQYALYRVFTFRRQPRFFELNGAVAENCQLDPVSYRASLR